MELSNRGEALDNDSRARAPSHSCTQKRAGGVHRGGKLLGASPPPPR